MRSVIACSMIALLAFVVVTPLMAEIDVNTASASELQSIKGIGPKTAQKIVDYRTEHGDFSSIDSVTRVKGIGAKTLAKMKASGLVCNPVEKAE